MDICHLDMADGNAQAKKILELELDGRMNFCELVANIIKIGDRGRELPSCKVMDSTLKNKWRKEKNVLRDLD